MRKSNNSWANYKKNKKTPYYSGLVIAMKCVKEEITAALLHYYDVTCHIV